MRRTLLLVLSTCLVASGLAAAWVSASRDAPPPPAPGLEDLVRLDVAAAFASPPAPPGVTVDEVGQAARTAQALMDVAMTVREGRTPGDVRADLLEVVGDRRYVAHLLDREPGHDDEAATSAWAVSTSPGSAPTDSRTLHRGWAARTDRDDGLRVLVVDLTEVRAFETADGLFVVERTVTVEQDRRGGGFWVGWHYIADAADLCAHEVDGLFQATGEPPPRDVARRLLHDEPSAAERSRLDAASRRCLERARL